MKQRGVSEEALEHGQRAEGSDGADGPLVVGCEAIRGPEGRKAENEGKSYIITSIVISSVFLLK